MWKNGCETHTKLRYVVELVEALRRKKYICLPGNRFERFAFDAKLVGHVFCMDLPLFVVCDDPLLEYTWVKMTMEGKVWRKGMGKDDNGR